MRHRRTEPFSAPPFGLVHRIDDPQTTTLPVPGYRQARNYCCGFATALMVLRHFDSGLCGRDLFDALGTARDGTGQSAIVRVLRSQGVSANVRYDMSFARLASCIDQGKPVVGYLEDEEHWLVIYGYGRDPQRVFVADPEPEKSCEHSWQGYGERLGGFGIVCSQRLASATLPELAPSTGPALVEHAQLSFSFGERV